MIKICLNLIYLIIKLNFYFDENLKIKLEFFFFLLFNNLIKLKYNFKFD